jgi:hypothetical protein
LEQSEKDREKDGRSLYVYTVNREVHGDASIKIVWPEQQ